jgi:hypothetical protein
MRAQRTFVIAALITVTAWTFTRAAERVDLLLVLAADISRSIDEAKFQLQRSGYAAAFSDPQVVETFRAGPTGRVAVTFIEWSGPLSQQIVVDWTLISNDRTRINSAIASGRRHARLRTARRLARDRLRDDATRSGTLRNAASPHRCFGGRRQQRWWLRDCGAGLRGRQGVTINGLAILTKPSSTPTTRTLRASLQTTTTTTLSAAPAHL